MDAEGRGVRANRHADIYGRSESADARDGGQRHVSATTAFVKAQAYAPIASPTLTGTPAAPTAGAGTNTTQIATTAFATTADNLKANLASPALTGTPTAPTAGAGTNTTQIATTAFVAANAPAGRAMLSTARMYYVRTDGSDSNVGTGNNAGGAFLTIQKAWDTVEKLDGGSNNVTITLGTGMTFAAGMVAYGAPVAFGFQTSRGITITGDSTVTANGGFYFLRTVHRQVHWRVQDQRPWQRLRYFLLLRRAG